MDDLIEKLHKALLPFARIPTGFRKGEDNMPDLRPISTCNTSEIAEHESPPFVRDVRYARQVLQEFEAAAPSQQAEIERLREALEEILAAFREYKRTTTAQAIARVKKAEIKADAALKGENNGS